MKRLIIVFSISLVVILSSCNAFYNPPTGSIIINKSIFDYNEEISVELSIESDPNSTIEVLWTLNADNLPITIENPYSFTFSLTPDITTTYTIKADISDGTESISIEEEFVVEQIPFLGTWRATSEENPAHASQMDIVGIWYIDGFELYYLDANGGDTIRQYSAKGPMTFPQEDQWITLTEEQYWNESAQEWQEWTLTDGIMYANYSFVNDELHMTVLLDMTSPADSAEYTWDFTKIDDSIDAWF